MADMLILGISLVPCLLHRTMKYTRKLHRRHHRHHRRRQWSRRQLRQITTTSWSARRRSSRISTAILPKTTCSRMISTFMIQRQGRKSLSRLLVEIHMQRSRESLTGTSFVYKISLCQEPPVQEHLVKSMEHALTMWVSQEQRLLAEQHRLTMQVESLAMQLHRR